MLQGSHLPVFTPPQRETSSDNSNESDCEENIVYTDEDFITETEKRHQYLSNKKDINDLIRDLRLSKPSAELLMFRLKQ